MAKEALKNKAKENQGGACDLTGTALPEETRLFDVDRKTSKAEGGTYTNANSRAVSPVAHMERHGNLRLREPFHDRLKAHVDDRCQIMKLKCKIENQIGAYKRNTDVPAVLVLAFLKDNIGMVANELKVRDKAVKESLKALAEHDPLINIALAVPSIGPITVAHCMVYIDLEKARHASSLWKYTGLHTASHNRYTKGESGGGNKTLRTVLYTMADSQMKGRGPYRVVYDNVKHRLEHSSNIVKSRNTQGKLIECAWKDTKPCHRHGAALRAVMKHFLADYWYVGRTLLNLDTTPCYAEAHLGGTHRTIMPKERGWVF